MNLKGNIRAVLETCFSETKEENINVALGSIVALVKVALMEHGVKLPGFNAPQEESDG